MSQDFKKLVAWQRAHKLTLAIYLQTKAFPISEQYGLTSQLRRAAYSVPANISEGAGRDTAKDFLRFLTIALGSLKETDYFLLLARDLGYLTEPEHELLSEAAERTFGALQGLINAVRRTPNSPKPANPQTRKPANR